MPTCPNGHQSGSDDWCEVCGHRMAGAVPPPPPPPPPAYGYPQSDQGQGGYGGGPDATAHAELCPQCRTPREALAPFCEECRWNFLTNQATYAPPAPQPGYGQQQRDPYEYQGSRPSQMNRPAEPFQQQAPYQQEYQQQPQHGGGNGGDDDWMLPPPSQQQGPPGGYQQQGHQQQGGFPQGGPGGGYQPDYPQGPQPGHQQGGGQWSATVGPDRDYFMAMMQRSGPEAGGLNLPAYSPEQQLQLTGNQITIGRRRHSTGESPDVDLAVPPEDPGVSHQHAVLVQQPDGTWAVVDQNSTNGTTINGGEDPIQPYVPVPLQDGDRVHVGAWTTITIHRN
ncbi:FHA domain-containing protein [Streptomyces sp. NPDC004111]|uniref:FHA domain-containing protein n=1 Tax=Streptomyces sp. NPDC004111 TaxID=3364690 RepID=UPI00367EDFA4